jgi:hypothetical protein
VPKIVPHARYGVAMLAALVSLAAVAVPMQKALGQKPSTPVTVVNPQVPVTVDNPATNPVPTSVVNPATNPALTSSVDDPGRVAYQSTNEADCGGAGGSCFLALSAVPPGRRLVVQHVSGRLSFTSNPGPVFVQVPATKSRSSVISFFFVPVNQFGSAGGFFSYFDQPVLGYLDAGALPRVEAFSGDPSFPGSTTGFFTVSGYLLDCTAAPCAPIAP